MDVLIERCAGLDVHRDTVVATVRRPGPGGIRRSETRTFTTMTGQLEALADWLTENVCPAIVSEPLRGVGFGFAAALNATVPGPLPLAPLVTVSQEVSLLTPVHAQPVGAVTVVEPVPPPAATD